MQIITLLKLLDQLGQYEGKTIHTYGRISSVGKRSTFYFISLRSGSCISELKVYLPKDCLSETPTIFSTLRVEGKIVKTPDGKSHELQTQKVHFYGKERPPSFLIARFSFKTLYSNIIVCRLK